MKFIKFIFIFIVLVLTLPELAGQIKIIGKITDSEGLPVFLANISVKGENIGTMTDQSGFYSLQIPEKENITIVVSCVGYKDKEFKLPLRKERSETINIELETDVTEIGEVSVSTRRERASTLRDINLEALQYSVSTSGSIESMIKTLPGVTSNSELSSQYSVRGGNFDENLVYVNDIEIYRPFLVRSGQQEGLSFINSDLVSSVRFSAGGFDARYGDKMSSVLDITYREPEKFGGSVSMSLLGGSAHLEGRTRNNRLSFLAGYRYKTTTYLLNSLDTDGEYEPNFSDFQTLINYQFSEKTRLSFLGNIALNKYTFIPEKGEIEFGTSDVPLNLVIYYEGQEIDKFITYNGAFSLTHQVKPELQLKFITSAFSTNERETFDILGEYLINELDNTIGSDTYGDSILNIGIGGFLSHARNYLNAHVFSASHLGEYNGRRNKIKWGIKYEYHRIFDKLSEWEMVDSAGFSVSAGQEGLELWDVIKGENTHITSRLSAYLQDTWAFRSNSNDYFITAGLRASYIDFNNEFILSPRTTFSYKPYWERDIMLYFSSGIYFQPPFYKEMRTREGILNKDIRSQRSIHFVAGGDYIFESWNRPFKFTTEIYYKHLSNLIPYKVNNVRIQYAGENLAKGYASGIDFKLNGQFVKDAESWVSLSFLRTREDIDGDQYIEAGPDGENRVIRPGYYPRPTDQLMNFGLYFQDYFPDNPDYKVHLTFLYGSRLPYGSPNKDRYDNVFYIPPYNRVDIGLSKVLKKETTALPEGNILRNFKNVWISAEVFNLLGIKNTVSYIWVRTVGNQMNLPGQFGVPNHLTGRRFNLKLTAKF